jgi:hypothetical protein
MTPSDTALQGMKESSSHHPRVWIVAIVFSVVVGGVSNDVNVSFSIFVWYFDYRPCQVDFMKK